MTYNGYRELTGVEGFLEKEDSETIKNKPPYKKLKFDEFLGKANSTGKVNVKVVNGNRQRFLFSDNATGDVEVFNDAQMFVESGSIWTYRDFHITSGNTCFVEDISITGLLKIFWGDRIEVTACDTILIFDTPQVGSRNVHIPASSGSTEVDVVLDVGRTGTIDYSIVGDVTGGVITCTSIDAGTYLNLPSFPPSSELQAPIVNANAMNTILVSSYSVEIAQNQDLFINFRSVVDDTGPTSYVQESGCIFSNYNALSDNTKNYFVYNSGSTLNFAYSSHVGGDVNSTLVGSTNYLTLGGGFGLKSFVNISPSSTATYDCGTTSSRWKDIFGTDLTITNTITCGGKITCGGDIDITGNIYPDTLNSNEVGTISKYFNKAHVGDVFLTSLSSLLYTFITCEDDFRPLTPKELGGNSNRWATIWGNDLDIFSTGTFGSLSVTNIITANGNIHSSGYVDIGNAGAQRFGNIFSEYLDVAANITCGNNVTVDNQLTILGKTYAGQYIELVPPSFETPAVILNKNKSITSLSQIGQHHFFCLNSTYGSAVMEAYITDNSTPTDYGKSSRIGFNVSNTTGTARRVTLFAGYNDIRPGTTDGSIKLGLSGNNWSEIWVTTAQFNTSDRDKKKDIEPCQLGLDFIKKLLPKKFRWRNEKLNEKADKKQYGFMAQDIQECLRQCGCEDFDGLRIDNLPEREERYEEKGEEVVKIIPASTEYALNYAAFTPILMKGVQEQQTQIETLKSIVQNQQTKIDLLLQRVVALENK